MTTIRRFCCDDLLHFANVNIDHLTETFNMSFYMTYLARWPDYFHVAVSPAGKIMGYIVKAVPSRTPRHRLSAKRHSLLKFIT
ncbi:unnamed protein product [Victoria cruziana]